GRCCDRCDPLPILAPVAPTLGAPEPATPVDDAAFTRLREWRKERAEGKPAYTVCRDEVLRQALVRRPRSLAELQLIPGVGPAFISRHGEDLLAVLGAAGSSGSASTPSRATGSPRRSRPARAWPSGASPRPRPPTAAPAPRPRSTSPRASPPRRPWGRPSGSA